MIKIKFRDETKSSFLIVCIFAVGTVWAFTGYGVLMDLQLIERELSRQIFISISLAGLIVLSIIYLPEIIRESRISFRNWKKEHYKDGVLEI